MVSMARPERTAALFILLLALALLPVMAGEAEAQRRGGGRGGPDRAGTPLPAGVPLGLRTRAPIPAENPITPEKVALGRQLFFDPQLSVDGTVACASCHRPELAFGDSTALSVGIDGHLGLRNSPSLLNRVFGRRFFWDGRASSLEEAVLMPVRDTLEMAMPIGDLVRRVAADSRYAALFHQAFPGAAISDTTISRALASYVRTLWTGDSPFDRFAAGDSTALTPAAQRGRALFFGRADCSDCHSGFNFTDEQFHALGVSAATRDRFKTPTLRNVALSAPYMHDGSLRTLEEVVEFYDRGGNGAAAVGGGGRRGRRIRPLGLSAEQRSDLVAFLHALTGSTAEGLELRTATR